MAKVLAVLSSGYAHAEHNYVTGWWAEELFAPMLILEEAGHVVDLASPDGGKPVVDPESLKEENDPNGIYRELYESGRADKTTPILDVPAREYDALYIVGGHGAMFDLARDQNLQVIVNIVYEMGGIVGALCHGPAALLRTKTKEDRYILEGLKVTGFPDAWEPEQVRPLLPFSLEQELVKQADYRPELDRKEYVVWGNDQILTGRDPASSALFGHELNARLPGLAD